MAAPNQHTAVLNPQQMVSPNLRVGVCKHPAQNALGTLADGSPQTQCSNCGEMTPAPTVILQLVDLHVYPLDDVIEHERGSEGCICGPEIHPVERDDGTFAWMYVHHSLDGREDDEVDE